MLNINIGKLLNPNRIKIREINPSMRLANKNDENISEQRVPLSSFSSFFGNRKTKEVIKRKTYEIITKFRNL